jgi:hypothetical protein
VKVVPANTTNRGQYRYRARAEWPDAVPPVARIWEGDFSIQ